jgi:hypothetical protein
LRVLARFFPARAGVRSGQLHRTKEIEMGLFSRKKGDDSSQDRRRVGLQTAWRSTGIDPRHLKYEATGADTAVVRDKRTGAVVQRQKG